jgi:hypothetical protein
MRDLIAAALIICVCALSYKLGVHDGYEAGWDDAIYTEQEYVCDIEIQA